MCHHDVDTVSWARRRRPKALPGDLVRGRNIADLRSLLRILEQLIERIGSHKTDDTD